MFDLLTIMIIITTFFSAVLIKPLIWQCQREQYSLHSLLIRPKLFIKKYAPYFLSGVLFSALYPLGLLFEKRAFFAVFAALYLTVLVIIVLFNLKQKDNQPLVMTRRATRLYVVTALAVAIVAAISTLDSFAKNSFWSGLHLLMIPIYAPLVKHFVSLILNPLEKMNNMRYLNNTKKLLDNPSLIKVAITGSYGKTTVKNILKEMLSEKYTVVATEGNYNTPLGISKSAQNIDSYTDVFIAEFGARHVGDIEKLAKIVKPQYGIVTGVTGQHLETFKTLDNIYSEKLGLLNKLSNDGFGFVNKNGIEKLIELPENACFVGGTKDDVHIENVVLSANGSTFDLIVGGESYLAETKLLGQHNLDNIAVAAALAVKLNVAPEKIIASIKRLKNVPHRLQPIKNGGLTVIDDTYNANPVGVEEALLVLKQFDGRKIVVTPGMVELGDKEDEENQKFGEKIAEVADVVILIGGKRADKIMDGLNLKGYSVKHILRYPRLIDAEVDFPKLFGTGDVVIFINDLPDNYL